jgi:hypothetical protein
MKNMPNLKRSNPSWDGSLCFLIIVGSGYFKIKSSKNCSGSILLFLENLENCSDLGLKNSKRGGYEVGADFKVYN